MDFYYVLIKTITIVANIHEFYQWLQKMKCIELIKSVLKSGLQYKNKLQLKLLSNAKYL